MRVFCLRNEEIEPERLLEFARGQASGIEGRFKGDDLGWTSAEFHFSTGSPILLERYLAKEDSLRADLNSWAAWLETADYSPNHTALMERVIRTQQLITLRRPIDHPDEVTLEALCSGLCRFIAQSADGVWQVDNQGFFAADGMMLLQEY